MLNFHLHIEGQVQGVGFRPQVYRLAKKNQLKGWVSNTRDGVHIEFNAPSRDIALSFRESIHQNSPPMARITGDHLGQVPFVAFESFEIRNEAHNAKADLLLSPDFGICFECRQEMKDPQNRRYQYPFITCTNCGPRYSILSTLPYDRAQTTMAKFKLCPDCKEEYHAVEDKRYFSQTNSCPKCSIQLCLRNSEGNILAQNSEYILTFIQAAWQNHRIVAVKGIGGYLLIADASSGQAIEALRNRKNRPSKPLALLYPDLERLGQDAIFTEKEQSKLLDARAPIVLLKLKETCGNDLRRELIAPGLDQIGAMLPYAPLLEFLVQDYDAPLVATSANMSGSPIIYENEQAFSELSSIADFVLSHNRDIVLPQDDSLIRFSPQYNHPILMRRSRGYAPSFFPSFEMPSKDSETILALGGDLKSSFTLRHQGRLYVSQYLGDLSEYRSQMSFRKTLEYFLELFQTQPSQIISDRHPEYFSHQLAQDLAEEWQVPHHQIPHHKAHFYAVLAENQALELEESEAVLGVIWDGLGLGEDKNIWGGEFFHYQKGKMSRVAHIPYYDYFLANKMSKEPRLSALSLMKGQEDLAKKILRDKFNRQEWNVYAKMLKKTNTLKTSSVGRLFDGIASILGLADRCTYEGEAALYLENLAQKYKDQSPWDGTYYPLFQDEDSSGQGFIEKLSRDHLRGLDKGYLALKFHYSLVEAIRSIAQRSNYSKIAFSGGVFQNALLVDLIQERLGGQYTLLFHQQLAPNDENISLGQIVAYQEEEKRASEPEKLSKTFVNH